MRITRRPRRGWAAVLAGAAAVAVLITVPNSYGTLTGTVTNSTNNAASAVFTCRNAVRSASAYLAYPLAETAGTTAADASANNRPGSYTAVGVTNGQSGPCPADAAKSALFAGLFGYAYGPGAAFTLTSPLSVQIWFRTSTILGGKLIGIGSSATGASGSYDRHIYMTNAGKLVWGVYPNAVKIVTSPSSYNDNRWHQAVGTLAPSSDDNPGLRLYVDGALVASDTTVTTAQSFSGYVRVGYDNLSSWTSAPTSYFFSGYLAWASVYSAALTPTQITGMYRIGSGT